MTVNEITEEQLLEAKKVLDESGHSFPPDLFLLSKKDVLRMLTNDKLTPQEAEDFIDQYTVEFQEAFSEDSGDDKQLNFNFEQEEEV